MSEGGGGGVARIHRIAGAVKRVEDAARWMARLVTVAAVAGAAGGAVLWWVVVGDRAADWWRGTLVSLLVLGICLLPSGWLLNARFALLALVELPEKLGGVATGRGDQLRRRSQPEVTPRGFGSAFRTVRDVVRDYSDVTGGWAVVAQLATPTFWVLTAAALAIVPVLVLAATVGALLDLVL